jgi:hypothetical protein
MAKNSGSFKPGQSGNPAGRVKGSLNKVTALCHDLLGDDAERLVGVLVKKAKSGDGLALKLCIERLVPIRASRDRAVSLDLPAVSRAEDLAAAAAAVIERAAAGEVTLSEAKEFMLLLDGQRKILETTDLVVRLEALELGNRTPAAGQSLNDPNVLARIRRTLSGHLEEDE